MIARWPASSPDRMANLWQAGLSDPAELHILEHQRGRQQRVIGEGVVAHLDQVREEPRQAAGDNHTDHGLGDLAVADEVTVQSLREGARGRSRWRPW